MRLEDGTKVVATSEVGDVEYGEIGTVLWFMPGDDSCPYDLYTVDFPDMGYAVDMRPEDIERA